LFESEEYADVTIQVGSEPNAKFFRVHSLILRTRSPFFRSELLKYATGNTKNIVLTFNQPNISVGIFEILLRYIYMGRIDIANYNVPDTLSILSAASKLELPDLCTYIQDYLLTFKKDLLKQHFALVNRIAKDFENLSAFCKEFLKKSPEFFLHDESFASFKKEELLDFYAKSSSLVKPIDLWDKLIEWGILQLKLTGKNHDALGDIVKPMIPYIDFKRIERVDFFQKVRPFRYVFNEDDYIQILESTLRDLSSKSSHPSSHPLYNPSPHPLHHPSSHPPSHLSSHPPSHSSSHPPSHPSSHPPAHSSTHPPSHP
ncbi:8374_t:CDS:2, partial [Acaulospora morrowiae]